MTINTENPILIIVILLLAASVAYAGYNYGHVNATTPTVITVTPVVTPIPTPTPDPTYLTNTVTISSMTTSGGFPQINIREDDRCFDVSYADYDRLSVGDRIQLHVVSTYRPYSCLVYKVDYVNIISHHRSNTHYYYYNHKYWRDDDHVTIEVTRDGANKHGYSRERPNWWLDD